MSQYKVVEHTRGELAAKHGIVSARLATLADALDATPEAVVEAAERAGIEPLVDTSDEKGRSRDADERPTDPSLRCLAFTVETFREVAAAVHAREAVESDSEAEPTTTRSRTR